MFRSPSRARMCYDVLIASRNYTKGDQMTRKEQTERIAVTRDKIDSVLEAMENAVGNEELDDLHRVAVERLADLQGIIASRL